AGKPEIDRKCICGLDHARNVPGAGRTGRRVGAGGRSRAATQERGDAGHQGSLDLLRADEVDVRVEAAGREDLAFARDDFGPGSDQDGDVRLDIRIAGLADAGDLAVPYSDIAFDDAPMVEDQRIGDNGVDRTLPVGDLALAHAVADDFAAAEFHLLAIGGEI